MRSVLLILAASGLMAAAGQSLADTQPAGAPDSTAPATSDTGAAPASPPAAAAASFQVGEPVKDNTGATIGKISDLKSDSSGAQTAVITMGAQSFQVAAANLGSDNGSAVINLTQAQISDMLKGKSGQ
jgi:hypothetical protein